MGEEGNAPEAFLNALDKLINNVGLGDLKLSQWGLKKEDAEKLAANSFSAIGYADLRRRGLHNPRFD